MAIKNEIDKGHVYYFEPNDTSIGKDQDGADVALVPHLEDLCIAMTLTADIYPRDKECIYKLDEENKNQMVRRSLSWISYVDADSVNVSKQIINSGAKMGDDNYLTTYYTEISADKYIENELVEGFGVTSVNISFESWFTPTISITFVDVHGSALWGREEAIHDNGEITSDNLLGVFFTQPYPLFRLQVKGFLGHDVTYQLSVRDFRGKYNSQTGNFEATATFIGYSWSLLTDIPLKLLSVVSEMSYVGKQYWDSHVSSPEWAMINADGTRTPPVKLYKLIQDIRSAVGALDVKDCIDCQGTPDGTTTVDAGGGIKDPTTENRNVSNEAAAKINAAKDAQNEIGLIGTALGNFIDECKFFTEDERKMNGKMIIGTSSDNGEMVSEQILMLFHCGQDGVVYPQDNLRATYMALNNAIENYNTKHTDNPFTNEIKVNFSKFHEDALEATKNNLKIEAVKIFAVSNDGKQKVALVNNGEFRKLTINGNGLFEDTAEKLESLYTAFNNQETMRLSGYKGFGDYAFLLPIGKMRSQIANIEKRLNAVGENIETKIENAIALQSNSCEYVRMKNNLSEGERIESTEKLKITAIIGFEPTIGNFVKLLMCHLETFIEVMMHCGDEIYKNLDKRIAANYGIELDTDTDISKNNKAAKSTKDAKDKPIWPWPALYNPSIKENSETTAQVDAQYETLGWTNDYPPTNEGVDWEEQKVILSFLNAIERYDEKANIRTADFINSVKSLPMSGSDLFSVSPFNKVGKSCKDIETLSPYLGLRIANVIGVADNLCSSEVAEAIGYMDALNLISSSSDYDKLKNAVTSKESNQDFVTQVIDYLTCKNNIRQTSETENGKKYNLFETILPNSGNEYSETRHPMFVEDGDNYKYTYAYTNSLDDTNANSPDDNGAVVTDNKKVSLIPTELYEFTLTNQPYTKLFTPNYKTEKGKKKLDFIPTITKSRNGDAKQKFVYTTKTNNVIPTKSIDEYTNSDLFFVNTDVQNVSDIVRRLQSIKDGNCKFKDYHVKGEKDDNKVKIFMDRRYKISLDEYYKIYNFEKNYRILMPALSKIDNDYYKTHLCNSIEQKYQVKYDTQWSTDTNSDLYKKTNLRVKTPGATFTNGTTEYSINDVLIGELPIFINSKVKGALFSSQIYYQQNNIVDEKLRDKAKAYLILSSMMSGIDDEKIEKDLFKLNVKSVIKTIPPFYVYFIGALLWRRSQENEPLYLGDYENSCPYNDTSFISKQDKIFYIETNKNKDWYKENCYSIKDYYMEYDKIDIAVRNKLIKLFENFANSKDYQLIRDNSELRAADKSIINGEGWKNLRAKWSNNNFDTKSAEQWSQIFGNMYDKYSSITVPTSTKSILRLLYNENNKAMQSLRTLYGLNGGFLVGRGTTKRVGLGNNEVTVTKSQMKRYLKGFYERILDVQKTAGKTNSEEISIGSSVVDRDYAIALYYSLKHLWDAWLITSARDQFTIKNFFNKYFVFIDSFYVNVYNTIKLNPKLILDAYDTKDPNLLSYMSNIIKEEGCMMFGLPSFADSNILKGYDSTVGNYKAHNDMSWKKENLAKLFTPIPFNEMGHIEPNNVFVFIYTHPYSNNALENTDKRFDSYMITETNKWPDVLNRGTLPTKSASSDRTFDENDYNLKLRPNNSIPDDTEELVSARYGYMMPCFGVTVNRGNNYIFKGLNVSMESPKVTSVAAQTYDNILSKTGADGSRQILFHGQDIYSVYSQYSYACEIEMMGCAQVQPLMYFQLLNIPMWRGTYMIYKVTHSLSPGTMTTKFTGVKMSRYQAPYATGYFTIVKKPAQTPSSSDTAVGTTSDNSQTEANTSTQTRFAVGGIKMVQAIFGKEDVKGFKKDDSDYDEPRGVIVKKDKNGKVIKRQKHWHCGTDIPDKEGIPLYAPWNGYVRIAKTNAGSAGNYLMFADNSNQVAVVFMHCMKLNVRKGDKVSAGGILAYLGRTGGNAVTNAPTTPHLHLELYVDGKFTMGESTNHDGPGTHVNPAEAHGYIGAT